MRKHCLLHRLKLALGFQVAELLCKEIWCELFESVLRCKLFTKKKKDEQPHAGNEKPFHWDLKIWRFESVCSLGWSRFTHSDLLTRGGKKQRQCVSSEKFNHPFSARVWPVADDKICIFKLSTYKDRTRYIYSRTVLLTALFRGFTFEYLHLLPSLYSTECPWQL